MAVTKGREPRTTAVKAHQLPPGRLPTTSTMGIDATIPRDLDRRDYEKAKIYRWDEAGVSGLDERSFAFPARTGSGRASRRAEENCSPIT
jgi:hypothetical protein